MLKQNENKLQNQESNEEEEIKHTYSRTEQPLSPTQWMQWYDRHSFDDCGIKKKMRNIIIKAAER